MTPGYEGFMAAIKIAEDAQRGMVKAITEMMRAGEPEELIYHHLAVTVNSDKNRAATAAMVALYRIAEAQLCDETGFAYASDITLDDDGLTIRSIGIPNGNDVAYSLTIAHPSNLVRYKFEPEFDDDGGATFTLTIRGLLFADENGVHVRNRVVREEDL